MCLTVTWSGGCGEEFSLMATEKGLIDRIPAVTPRVKNLICNELVFRELISNRYGHIHWRRPLWHCERVSGAILHHGISDQPTMCQNLGIVKKPRAEN